MAILDIPEQVSERAPFLGVLESSELLEQKKQKLALSTEKRSNSKPPLSKSEKKQSYWLSKGIGHTSADIDET
jgi:hypothetical protein